MQNIDIDDIREMENPRGLDIIHPEGSPTLSKIIDAEGKQVYSEMFISRQKAEYRLYLILLEDGKTAKKARNKQRKADEKMAFEEQNITNYSHKKDK